MPTWREIEAERLAAESGGIDDDALVVEVESSRDEDHLARRGLLSGEGRRRVEELIGPIRLDCPSCRVAFDIGDRAPGDLVTCPGCRVDLGVPHPESWTPPRPAHPEDPHGLVGETLEGIRFDRVLFAEHGTVVYRAWEPSYGRAVAAKSYDPGRFGDAEHVERIRQEVRLALGLAHENLVRILGLVTRHERRILIMEYVEGLAVIDLLDQTWTMPIDRSLSIVRDVARALEYLHGRGMVHRDVKPGNIFLGLDGAVRLGDLELLERTRPPGDESPVDEILGTPVYMAPELIEGRPARPASDFYALGVSLHQMLTGELPYDGVDTRAVLRAIIGGERPPVADLGPRLPAWICRALDRLLEPDPDLRPASREAFEALLTPTA